MTKERTLSIIKPDAVRRDLIGEINRRFEAVGLSIVACRMLHLTQEQAEGFYDVHRERPFFSSLVEYMQSGPILVQVLEGRKAISANRTIMGATNPADAAPGTIRADLAESLERNSVHGSDSGATAKTEIEFFFSPDQIHSRSLYVV